MLVTYLVSIFFIDVVFNSLSAELGEVLGPDLNQIRDGGLESQQNSVHLHGQECIQE